MEANVDAGVAEQESVYNNSRAVSGVTFVLVLVFFVVAVIGSVRTVVNPVKSVTTQLNDILKEIESGNGDLTRRISLKNKDEIGQLAGGINVFLETLQQIMSRIVIDSREMGEIVSRVSGSVGTANSNACDISAVMEELSATMQEVASAVNTVNTNVAQIGQDVNEITKEERQRLVHLIKDFTMTLTGLRSYNEAIITKGGVSVKEIDPGTMESKKMKGLYFAGEVLDLDAVTGGYNLQIAWSTGYLAGINAGCD